ncbi:hypothetical protein T12_12444 [Trichinella patagoniensis]|uniref:Uncharacterized protein n=1 Tax=Trichinella patagoniensis TaxID=990121 RepID=A0A0V0Z4C5_9BILA|nr:hypothetical protein T12_12444 [Trichinella patagoniensis]
MPNCTSSGNISSFPNDANNGVTRVTSCTLELYASIIHGSSSSQVLRLSLHMVAVDTILTLALLWNFTPDQCAAAAEHSKGLAKSNHNPCIGYPVPIGCNGVLLPFEYPFLVAHCLHVLHYTHIHMLIPDQ